MAKQRGVWLNTPSLDDRVLATLLQNTPGYEELFYTVLLGLEPVSVPDLVDRVQSGLPFSAWETFSKYTRLPEKALLELTHISRATIYRRKKTGHLESLESERLLRVARVFGKTLRMFRGDLGKAQKWFTTLRSSLGGKTPFEMTISEIGATEVEDVIGRIRYGIYS